jgi:serine/threonine protein kinase
LTKKGKYPEAEARKIYNEMLKGMKELVDNNIIHRDLKPENILINNGIHMIADFGFSKTVGDFNKGMLTTACGTPLYMAP